MRLLTWRRTLALGDAACQRDRLDATDRVRVGLAVGVVLAERGQDRLRVPAARTLKGHHAVALRRVAADRLVVVGHRDLRVVVGAGAAQRVEVGHRALDRAPRAGDRDRVHLDRVARKQAGRRAVTDLTLESEQLGDRSRDRRQALFGPARLSLLLAD